MQSFSLTATWLLALVMLAGCASSDVTTRRSYVGDEQLDRPDRVIVHNFAATADDIPPDAAIAGRQFVGPTSLFEANYTNCGRGGAGQSRRSNAILTAPRRPASEAWRMACLYWLSG